MDQPRASEEASGGLENLIKVEDVAELFGISHKTVYKLVDSGVLPHVRFGRAIRFAPSALRALTDLATPHRM